METLAIVQWGFAPALASALLHALWQDTLLALAAALTLAALSGRSAALRHAVAMAFLVAMVGVPALRFAQFWMEPVAEINAGLIPAMTTVRLDGAGAGFVQQSGTTASVVAALWLIGVVLVLLRHASGLGLVRAMERRHYEILPPHWQRRVSELRNALSIARAISVRLSRDVVTPFTARLLRPTIWLPLSLLTQMPAEQLEALLAHELAHIARKDWLWNGLQCVLEALLFFHPAAWWLGRRIRQEREHACDDLAVMACGDAIALAEALTALERCRHSSPRLVLAAQGGSLMQRITRLLSAPPTRGGWAVRIALGVMLTTGAVAAAQIGLAGNWKPQLHVHATTDGPLRPGDMREITANGVDGQRYYRESIDAQGRRTEIYQKDGQPWPIDAGVRRWLAEIDRMSVPPLPPVPPAPPVPPPAPRITDAVEFKTLVQLVAADPKVIARVGTPARVQGNEVDGRISIDKSNGDADLRFDIEGPKGRAKVEVEATLTNGRWRLDDLDAQ